MTDDVAQKGAGDPASETELASESETEYARRVVCSYPADLSVWGVIQIEKPAFRAWLGKTLGAVERGEVREVFLDAGCCGDTLDLPVRIERVEGGSTVGPETEIEFEERDAEGLENGWRVQSAGAPEP